MAIYLECFSEGKGNTEVFLKGDIPGNLEKHLRTEHEDRLNYIREEIAPIYTYNIVDTYHIFSSTRYINKDGVTQIVTRYLILSKDFCEKRFDALWEKRAVFTPPGYLLMLEELGDWTAPQNIWARHYNRRVPDASACPTWKKLTGGGENAKEIAGQGHRKHLLKVSDTVSGKDILQLWHEIDYYTYKAVDGYRNGYGWGNSFATYTDAEHAFNTYNRCAEWWQESGLKIKAQDELNDVDVIPVRQGVSLKRKDGGNINQRYITPYIFSEESDEDFFDRSAHYRRRFLWTVLTVTVMIHFVVFWVFCAPTIRCWRSYNQIVSAESTDIGKFCRRAAHKNQYVQKWKDIAAIFNSIGKSYGNEEIHLANLKKLADKETQNAYNPLQLIYLEQIPLSYENSFWSYGALTEICKKIESTPDAVFHNEKEDRKEKLLNTYRQIRGETTYVHLVKQNSVLPDELLPRQKEYILTEGCIQSSRTSVFIEKLLQPGKKIRFSQGYIKQNSTSAFIKELLRKDEYILTEGCIKLYNDATAGLEVIHLSPENPLNVDLTKDCIKLAFQHRDIPRTLFLNVTSKNDSKERIFSNFSDSSCLAVSFPYDNNRKQALFLSERFQDAIAKNITASPEKVEASRQNKPISINLTAHHLEEIEEDYGIILSLNDNFDVCTDKEIWFSFPKLLDGNNVQIENLPGLTCINLFPGHELTLDYLDYLIKFRTKVKASEQLRSELQKICARNQVFNVEQSLEFIAEQMFDMNTEVQRMNQICNDITEKLEYKLQSENDDRGLAKLFQTVNLYKETEVDIPDEQSHKKRREAFKDVLYAAQSLGLSSDLTDPKGMKAKTDFCLRKPINGGENQNTIRDVKQFMAFCAKFSEALAGSSAYESEKPSQAVIDDLARAVAWPHEPANYHSEEEKCKAIIEGVHNRPQDILNFIQGETFAAELQKPQKNTDMLVEEYKRLTKNELVRNLLLAQSDILNKSYSEKKEKSNQEHLNDLNAVREDLVRVFRSSFLRFNLNEHLKNTFRDEISDDPDAENATLSDLYMLMNNLDAQYMNNKRKDYILRRYAVIIRNEKLCKKLEKVFYAGLLDLSVSLAVDFRYYIWEKKLRDIDSPRLLTHLEEALPEPEKEPSRRERYNKTVLQKKDKEAIITTLALSPEQPIRNHHIIRYAILRYMSRKLEEAAKEAMNLQLKSIELDERQGDLLWKLQTAPTK